MPWGVVAGDSTAAEKGRRSAVPVVEILHVAHQLADRAAPVGFQVKGNLQASILGLPQQLGDRLIFKRVAPPPGNDQEIDARLLQPRHVLRYDGRVVRTDEVAVGGPIMAHDMGLTERYAIALDLPVPRVGVGGVRPVPRPPDGIPQNIADHMRLMIDVLVLGFQTDTTRIATLKLNNDHSSLRFPNLGIDYMIHHLLSHSDTGDWLKVNQFFVEQVAYLARKLDAIQEGPRTALDNSMLLFCSSMMSGSHDATQLPVIMVGGAGGKLKGGRVLDYREQPERQMCRLYLSIMKKMGVEADQFGDATEPLDDV